MIDVYCSSSEHPVYSYLVDWIKGKKGTPEIKLTTNKNDLIGGKILFLISVGEKISEELLREYERAYVLHASDLPKGRGWSPHIWEILAGADEITLSMIEAKDPVDSGDIYAQEKIPLDGYELYDEINDKLFRAELRLMDRAINGEVFRRPQEGKGSYYRKRKPEDSEIDPTRSILDQLDELRVADYNRFPAYFIFGSQKYIIKLEKDDDDSRFVK